MDLPSNGWPRVAMEDLFPGEIQGQVARILVNMGATRMLVAEDLVPKELYIAKQVWVQGYAGPVSGLRELAVVDFTMGCITVKEEVAVVPNASVAPVDAHFGRMVSSEVVGTLCRWGLGWKESQAVQKRVSGLKGKQEGRLQTRPET